MTSRLKTMDKENEIESDWKFAAMVIDRSLPKLRIHLLQLSQIM